MKIYDLLLHDNGTLRFFSHLPKRKGRIIIDFYVNFFRQCHKTHLPNYFLMIRTNHWKGRVIKLARVERKEEIIINLLVFRMLTWIPSTFIILSLTFFATMAMPRLGEVTSIRITFVRRQIYDFSTSFFYSFYSSSSYFFLFSLFLPVAC